MTSEEHSTCRGCRGTDFAARSLVVRMQIATLALAVAALTGSACRSASPPAPAEAGELVPAPSLQRAVLAPEPAKAESGIEAEAATRRARLVELVARQVEDPRVLDAMRRVPRHRFMPPGVALDEAYGDWPSPIGQGQTISQPSLVGEMTEALALTGRERVLEIGTGSGYQAAILSLLAREVFTIEIVPELGMRAASTLRDLHHSNVYVRIGDGYAGWPEHAPFDRIILTAAPPEVPKALLDQLAEGGILVAPVGEEGAIQELMRIEKKKGGALVREHLGAVRFVPMVRERR